MEIKRYKHPTIAICRTCRGSGRVITYPRYDILQQRPNEVDCPDCLGSGRVVVSKEITIKVVAYMQK